MKRLTLTLGLLALAAVLAACSGASAAARDRRPRRPAARAATPSRRRQGHEVQPRPRSRSRPATPFNIAFDNQDGAPHNIAITRRVRRERLQGRDRLEHRRSPTQVPALAAGTYTFICEVHPDMKGTITAQ